MNSVTLSAWCEMCDQAVSGFNERLCEHCKNTKQKYEKSINKIKANSKKEKTNSSHRKP